TNHSHFLHDLTTLHSETTVLSSFPYCNPDHSPLPSFPTRRSSDLGKFSVAGTDRVKTIEEIAGAAYVPHNYPLEILEPGLEEQAYYDPVNFTYPGGCHRSEERRVGRECRSWSWTWRGEMARLCGHGV